MQFLSIKTYNHFKSISDETYKDLISYAKTTPEIVERAKKQIFTYYQGVDKEGIVRFITPSGTTPGLYYTQFIQLVELPLLIKKFKNSKKNLDIVKLALQGRIKMSCQFPNGKKENSWLYWGHKYKASVSGYNYGDGEDRFPKIRNPKLKGGGCKHLRAVLASLPFHATIITKDLDKQGAFD
jgi:hypothetical protein